jgi:HAMP domain-containing protein
VQSTQDLAARTKFVWHLAGLVCLAALASSALRARAAEPDRDLRLAVAVTQPTERPPATTISLLDPRSGAVSELYRDPEAGRHLLVKIAGSDVLGSARAAPPADLYAFIGPTVADPNALDALSVLRVPRPGVRAAWKQVLEVPLSFSEASPYGLWNRAPLLAVSPRQDRAAITALRIGERALAGPMIRVLSMYGTEEWQLAIGKGLRVVDFAWSPDGKQLAYALSPEGDEHTLEESLLPQAGIYLADVAARTSSFLHHCYPAAVAWAPKGDHITIAVQPDVWGPAGVVRTVGSPGGKRSEEFSVAGSAEALAWSDDGRWLAVQVSEKGTQVVQVRASSGDWGREVFRLPAAEGRLALLGWVRAPNGG